MAVPRVGVIGISVLTACFDPTIRTGLECTTECPRGQVCHAGTCWIEGTIPDAATADARSDAAGAGDGPGHDEDQDGIADVTDRCPHIADPMQPDGDDDGVGDDCDPSPFLQHRIAFFDPLTSQRPEWTFNTGTWSYGPDGTLMVSGISVASLKFPLGESVVQIGGRIDVVAADTHQITMTLSNDGMASYYCEIYDAGMPVHNLTQLVGTTYTQLGQNPLPPLVPGPLTFSAAESVTDGVMRCRTQLDGGAVSELATMATIAATTPMRMRFQGLSATLDYMIRIETVP